MCRLLIKLWSIIMIWNGPNMTWLNAFCRTPSLVFFTCSCLFQVFLDHLDLIEVIMYLTSVIVFDKFKIKQSEPFSITIIVNTIIIILVKYKVYVYYCFSAGPLCLARHKAVDRRLDDDFPTFRKFNKSLSVTCDEGKVTGIVYYVQ